MVRVRFAPSPTGELHVGGARTALYNYLFAKKNGGDFIIRIEDTDRERFVEGSLERLLAGLKWLGLNWQEGPDVGGKCGPYVQSERLELYKKYADQLVASGAAYYCFCSSERLSVLREVQQAQKQPTKYDRECLKLNSSQVKEKISQGDKYVLRLKVPAGITKFDDIIRGTVTIANDTLDDQVLLKSDGFPTYHLACVVDDHLMSITHVIRAEEWLPSTPKHIILYKALGWELPKFAHLPDVLNDKRAKLSKRKDGAAVWVQTYQAQGYLSEAIVNFLALLGWHPQDDQELFSLEELIHKFSLERVQKGGAIFSVQKLNWFNAAYIKKMAIPELDLLLKPFYEKLIGKYGRDIKDTNNLTQLLQSRLITLSDAEQHARWFFTNNLPLIPESLVPAKGDVQKTKLALDYAAGAWANSNSWTIEALKGALEHFVSDGIFTKGELLWPVRVALTGEKQSPDVFDVAFVLGRAEALRRLEKAQAALG